MTNGSVVYVKTILMRTEDFVLCMIVNKLWVVLTTWKGGFNKAQEGDQKLKPQGNVECCWKRSNMARKVDYCGAPSPRWMANMMPFEMVMKTLLFPLNSEVVDLLFRIEALAGACSLRVALCELAVEPCSSGVDVSTS